MLADNACNADHIRASFPERRGVRQYPTQDQPAVEAVLQRALYRERNPIERFFSKLKHFRRVATRYDKLADNFLAMVQLASMRLWLRAYESMA